MGRVKTAENPAAPQHSWPAPQESAADDAQSAIIIHSHSSYPHHHHYPHNHHTHRHHHGHPVHNNVHHHCDNHQRTFNIPYNHRRRLQKRFILQTFKPYFHQNYTALPQDYTVLPLELYCAFIKNYTILSSISYTELPLESYHILSFRFDYDNAYS